MSDPSNLRIAGISAAVTLAVSGLITLGFASDIFGSAVPQSAASDGQSAPQSTNGAKTKEAEQPQSESSSSEAATPPSTEEQPAPPQADRQKDQPIPAPDVDCEVARCVALTFDDGPDKNVTPKVLDTLKKTSTPATFFQVGREFAGNEALVKRALADGHVLGTHTWTHPQLPLLNPDELNEELANTIAASEQISGTRPTLMRPPYGLFNDAVIDKTIELGNSVIMWDVDTEDWKNKNPQETAKRALEGAHRGAIILMHDVHPSTAEALPTIIAELRKNGYSLVTIPQLLGNPTPGTVYYSGTLDQ